MPILKMDILNDDYVLWNVERYLMSKKRVGGRVFVQESEKSTQKNKALTTGSTACFSEPTSDINNGILGSKSFARHKALNRKCFSGRNNFRFRMGG